MLQMANATKAKKMIYSRDKVEPRKLLCLVFPSNIDEHWRYVENSTMRVRCMLLNSTKIDGAVIRRIRRESKSINFGTLMNPYLCGHGFLASPDRLHSFRRRLKYQNFSKQALQRTKTSGASEVSLLQSADQSGQALITNTAAILLHALD